jgi:hypothetical protein
MSCIDYLGETKSADWLQITSIALLVIVFQQFSRAWDLSADLSTALRSAQGDKYGGDIDKNIKVGGW